MLPNYDFNLSLFKQRPFLIRLAKDHISLSEMKSDVIDFEVVKTTDLDIPVVYHVHYRFKSITGIDDNRQPIYGNHHIAEFSLARPYPLEPCKVYMKSDVWHPNIKWDGRLKGRVCSNVDKLGIAFDLFGLVLWVGEILQYKNYHATDEPPFPEDANVAKWVLNFAEPNGIVNKEKEIYVDETSLLIYEKANNGKPPIKKETPATSEKEQPKIAAKQETTLPKVESIPTAPPPSQQQETPATPTLEAVATAPPQTDTPEPEPEAEAAPDSKPTKLKINIKKKIPRKLPLPGFKIKPRK